MLIRGFFLTAKLLRCIYTLDRFPANKAIESALMTRTIAAISFNPTGSRRITALLKTPTTGMARVLMAATLAGKMRTRVKYAQWQ